MVSGLPLLPDPPLPLPLLPGDDEPQAASSGPEAAAAAPRPVPFSTERRDHCVEFPPRDVIASP
jgi:hypothetical protein